MNMHDDFEKSRTQLKKEATALQKMGEKLVLLSDDQLGRMDLPTRLMEAIQTVRAIKSHGARRRQMQYIGSLMRSVDAEPIEQALLSIEQGAYGQAKVFQVILDTFPDADRRRLGQLVRSARKEKEKNAPPKSARNLFRYLKALAAGK